LVAAFVIGKTAGAQRVDYSKRPAVPPLAPFHFPTIHAHRLPNGVRLFVVEDHSIPLVSARILVADASSDPRGKAGLDSLMLAAMREGTTTRDATQLAEAFADIGATILPTRFTVTTDAAPSAVALVADMLMHPTFDSAAVERQKSVQANAARALALNPAVPARRLFHAVLAGTDDVGVRALALGDPRVNTLTRDDVVAHWRSVIGPKSTTIVLAGDVSDARALSLVAQAFGEWSASGVQPVRAPAIAAPRATTIYLADAPSATDAFVIVGNAAPPRSSPQYYAAEAVSAVVSMRMRQEMRERRSLMYSGSAAMEWPAAPQPSAFVGATRFALAKTDTALAAWLDLLRDLHTGRSITADELDAARRSLLGALSAKMDGPDMLADRVADVVRDRAPLDCYDAYYAAVSRLTLDQVNAAAAKFIDVDHLAIAIVGPRATLEPLLRAARLAPVEIVDVSAAPVK
jgi:zinc protease